MLRMGRPSKLTPEVARRVVATIRAGRSKTRAAREAGVALSTLMDWLRRGREYGEPGYAAFSNRVKRAEQAAREDYLAAYQAAYRAAWERQEEAVDLAIEAALSGLLP